jgi:hypothetical protein
LVEKRSTLLSHEEKLNALARSLSDRQATVERAEEQRRMKEQQMARLTAIVDA